MSIQEGEAKIPCLRKMCRCEGGSSKDLFPWGHNVSMLLRLYLTSWLKRHAFISIRGEMGRRAESESVFVSAANGVGSSPAGWAISGLDGPL